MDAIKPHANTPTEDLLTVNDHRQLALNALHAAELTSKGETFDGPGDLSPSHYLQVAHIHALLAQSAKELPGGDVEGIAY